MTSVGNQVLGPLAEVQVHATDPHGRCAGQWRGKSQFPEPAPDTPSARV
ncbi:hypothetical protein [Streptomyces sp. NPDC004629]